MVAARGAVFLVFGKTEPGEFFGVAQLGADKAFVVLPGEVRDLRDKADGLARAGVGAQGRVVRALLNFKNAANGSVGGDDFIHVSHFTDLAYLGTPCALARARRRRPFKRMKPVASLWLYQLLTPSIEAMSPS